MDKSRVCLSRTINLAKQQNEKKTNLLVYEKRKGPPPLRKPMYQAPAISALPAKHIRVCTGAELKRMCPPKPCGCPPRQPPPGFFTILGRMFGFGMKTILAGALVYWTWDQGLWGDSEKSEEFYSNTCQTFLPVFCPPDSKPKKKKLSPACEAEKELMNVPPPRKNIPPECTKPPINTERALFSMKEKWNHAITCLFSGITGFPNNIINKFTKKKEKEKICFEKPDE